MAMKETKGIKRKETNMTADSARTANLKRVSEEAARKKAAKKPTAMKASARSHQGDLARMSGATAATKKFKADKKAGKMYKETGTNPAFAAGKKAEKRTLKSFK